MSCEVNGGTCTASETFGIWDAVPVVGGIDSETVVFGGAVGASTGGGIGISGACVGSGI